MTRAAALGVTTVLASTLAGEAAKAATPKKGGTFNLAMGHGDTANTIDPATLLNGYQWAMGYAYRNTLTQVAAGGKLDPCLAESWESSDDAKEWYFNLRQGVEFHDGKSLTAEDVVASVNHHRTEDTKSFIKPIAAEIEEITADGANKVVCKLKSGNVDYPYMLASAGFLICPAKDDGTIDWESGNGTGGYVLKNYDPGVNAHLVRNPNYWRDDRAHVEEVNFLTIHDPAARTNALLTGEVDVVDQVDIKTVDRLAKISGMQVEETSGPRHYNFAMRVGIPPFDNNDVRLALKYAMDREELLQKILKGHGRVGNDNSIGVSYQYFDPNLEQLTYDPEKAKFYLKKAGLSSLDVQLSAADAAFTGAVDTAILYREHALPAGINIEVIREPNDGYWSTVNGKKGFSASYWGGYTTETEMFTTGYTPGAAWNETNFDNPAFTKLLSEVKAELNTSKRREMLSELQRILRDEGGVIIPFFASDILARSERVAHGELAADRGFDGRHIIERWWIA
jgi:peptide/nickel transport system substrate-binding protein